MAWAECGCARCGAAEAVVAACGMQGALVGELRLLLESPALGKKEIPAASCGRFWRRKASRKGREARGEREEAGGELSHLFHVLEKATHLGGFRPAGKRL